MKIVAAEVSIVEIPFKLRGPGVGIMPTAWKSLEFALVRLEDEQGNVGWGEGFGYFTVDATKAVIDRLIIPTLLGATIEDIPAWNAQTQRRLHMFGRYGITIFAISGVDIALWDLAAKRAGKPLHQLLRQGPSRATIPFYASLMRYGDARIAAESCEEALAAGFTALKLHEIGLGEITACRSAVGPGIELCTDVNCAWSADFVAAHRDELARLNLSWLEEPIYPPEDFDALSRLRHPSLRIGAGENWCTTRQFAQALDHGAVDIVQPSMTKVGGVSEFLAVLALPGLGEAVTVMPHSPYFGPGFYASLHVAAARPVVQALEYNFVDPDAWLSDVGSLRRGDVVDVPQGPGLGFEPDPAVYARYRRA